jgi:chromosome segregation ATPase
LSLESLVGNLFVLAAVVVILVVYRQLDKNNRSLEKIRKYADSVREDLNAFVEERTAAVRDFEAVLKVHDKTGAEILKRIQALEGGLLTRVPEIEQLQARLDRYAGSMTELETQTKRIDTHLERVKEETVFVDRVSQRIKTAGEQMTTLEGSFSQIRQEFADINQKDLEIVRKNTFEVFEQETLAYVKKLAEAEQRVASFEAFVNELDSKRNAFVREAEAALDAKTREAITGAEAALLDTARQAEDLSMVVFLKLEEKIESQAQETEKRLRAALDQSEDAVRQANQETADRLRAIDDAVEARTVLLNSLGAKSEDAEAQLRANFESEQAQLLSMTAQLKTDLDAAVAQARQLASDEADAVRREFNSSLELDRQTAQAMTAEVRELIDATRHATQEEERRTVETVEARLAEYETAFAYRFSQLEQAEKDLGELDQNLRQAMEKAADKIQADFTAFDEAMAARRQEEQAALERKLGTANDSLVRLDADLEQLKVRAYDNISQKFQGVEEQFFADLQRRAASMTESMEDWQKSLNARLEELRETGQTERAEAERLAGEEFRARVQEIQNASFQQLEKLDRQIQEGQEAANAAVSNYRDEVEKTRIRLATELSELEHGVEARLGQDRSRIELSATESLTKLERDLEARIRALTDGLDKVHSDYHSGLDAAQAEFIQWQNRFAQRFKELDDNFHEQQEALKTSMAERIGVLTLDVETQRQELVDRSAEDRQTLRSDMAQIRAQVDDLDGALRSRSQAAIEAFTREQEGLSKELLERSAEDRQALKNNIAEIHAQISELEGSLRARSQTAFDTLTNEQDALSKELLERSSDDRQALKNDLIQIRAAIDELDGSLRSRSQAAIEAFRREQEEVSKELLERSSDDRATFKSDLAQIRAQIDDLDGSLRSRSQAAFDAFARDQDILAKELLERSTEERETLKTDISQIRATVNELDGTLRSRSQAVFDAFERDQQILSKELLERTSEERETLRTDLAQLRAAVDELDGSLRSRSQDVLEAFRREQEEASRELLERSSEDRATFKSDLAQIRAQIDELEGSLRARSQAAFDAFERDQEALSKELLEGSSEERETLKNDLTQIRAAINELDGSFRSRSQAALEAFRREQEEVSRELLERSADDRQTFKSDLAQIRAQIDELDTSLRSRSQAAIETFTRDHQELAKELLERSTDEREALKNDLAQIRGLVDELDGSLRSRSQAALEAFSREYDELAQEFQKKNRDLAADIETRVRDYRDAVADTRDKADAQQKKAFAKLEDQTAALNATLDEIDKRQKGFIAQTKIFERADTLRQDLTQAVEDLKADIARVEVQRKDLFEIEATIARIKKIGDETSDKAAKFTAEKKRIDLMDADFQRIVSLSQSMELRLEQVTSSHDLLQDMQLRIRKLEEYSKDVETRYDRLEKRREVLDTTTDGVDRNFALLEKVETTVRGLDTELKAMPAEVEDLRKRLKVLAQGKEDADHAVERLRTLDQTLKDVEGRIGRMEQAREWIAGVETRLTETKAAADESVQTLATIHKASGAPVAKGKADGDMRNTVLKLARQGWGKEEISRATKLSLGEVELILELGTR